MKSKTSCFNRTIFKKNFTHFWPLWLLYQIYLLVVIPVWVWQKAASPYYYYGTGNEDTTYRMYQLVELAVHRMIPPLPVFFFAVAAALAVFSYLYSAKSANMMHALPVNRLELYVTNYLSGLIFLIVPEIITFFISARMPGKPVYLYTVSVRCAVGTGWCDIFCILTCGFRGDVHRAGVCNAMLLCDRQLSVCGMHVYCCKGD